ncbi:hypothetical protein V5799_005308 [Amblyomma americanum]|uniref:FP protein C-terminal domain-containing protein n=1 Tax=Amblyomma americanum TaxID=6943 RepID=A0AAQ4DZM1_AMBAM
MERDLRSEIRDLKSEQKNITQSLDFAHGTIDDLKKKLDDEVAKTRQKAAEYEALQARLTLMEAKLKDLENRQTHSEQYSRKNNLEIQGVAKSENESVTDILAKIGDAVKEPITQNDVEACHRVPTRNPDKANIIVQFRSRAKRDNVLGKAKKTRFTNSTIGLDTSDPIYINEHLCPVLKKLLALTVKKKYENRWKSVWTSNGKIFAKQADGMPAVQILTELDIDKIFSAQASVASSSNDNE